MIRVVWWTCALLAAAHARIYDRCELARELQNLGVWHEHVSTWVCIAYHESRFDTAANNPHSGDHGIFQISELYWCGGGKACGLSCDALRDDNIADDLQCARRVHEEHTRLQGDGFQAWVVYPQHCKGNTKKYLAGCGLRTGFARTMGDINSIAVHDAFQSTDSAYKNNPNIDNLLPSYLMISSIFRDSYGKITDYNKNKNVDWFNYKYDKVDDLKLPALRPKVNEVNEVNEPLEFMTKVDRLVPNPITTTIKTTSTKTYIPPVMAWRFIESNQFRKKATPGDTITTKPTTKQDFTLQFENHTEKLVYNASSTKLITKQNKIAYEKYTISPSYSPLATESTTQKSTSTVIRDISPNFKSTTDSYKSHTASLKPVNKTNTAYKLAFTTSYRSMSPTGLTTSSYKFTPPSWWHTTTTPKALVSTTAPFLHVTKAYTSVKPPTIPAPVKSTIKSAPRYTFMSRNSELPTTTIHTTPSVPQNPTTAATPTTRPLQKTSRSTQSIWDLYLNPTKPPKYEPFNLSRGNSKYKLNIFSDGTTTVLPSQNNTWKYT